LPDVRARRPVLACAPEPALDAVAMRRTHHDVLLEDVVRQAGRAELLDDVALAVCARRDLADVGVDHHRAYAGELSAREQVLDDVELRPLAVELEIDLVRRPQICPKPLARADEATGSACRGDENLSANRLAPMLPASCRIRSHVSSQSPKRHTVTRSSARASSAGQQAALGSKQTMRSNAYFGSRTASSVEPT
jgi:hypothetical protein